MEYFFETISLNADECREKQPIKYPVAHVSNKLGSWGPRSELPYPFIYSLNTYLIIYLFTTVSVDGTDPLADWGRANAARWFAIFCWRGNCF